MPFIRPMGAAISSLLAFTFSFNAYADNQWLVVAQGEVVNTGQQLAFQIVKPPDTEHWPATVRLKLSAAGVADEVELALQDSSDQTLASRTYSGTPRQDFVGVVRAELVEKPSNTVLLLAASRDDTTSIVQAGEIQPADSVLASSNTAPQVVIAAPDDEPALSAEEPMYFLFGNGDEYGTDARFQISFKYRPFDSKGSVAQYAPFLSNLYFSYTQTTLWDIGGDSSPFRDTSYRPGLFYRWAGASRGLYPDSWRVGIEHESNGQGGVDSRSLNIAYVRPSWHLDFANGRRLTFSPKIYAYIDKDENPDIQHYRGYADWQLRYGREDGLMVTGLYRQGTRGYAMGQLDISYPLSDRILSRIGTFAHLQIFSGYGETLLDYDKDRDTQIRLGISVSR
ncbi:phospholipase A [Methylobacillus arboreus]|uniref:phospholipase A n=1 Tax=Methylobacillus arboreus TaxID=755170 RepID=UPI001E34637E|nr:phospholipase A [Methylobacillus arboreus]MCB5189827.1 phospholipase A [Methylobacillus arboreus]